MALRWLGTCLILALWHGSAQAQVQQQTRIAVVVGNNLGNDPGRTLRYAEAEASRLAILLRSAGNFDDVISVAFFLLGEGCDQSIQQVTGSGTVNG